MRVPKSTTKLQGFAGQRQASEIEKILSAEQVQPNSGSRSRSRESAANFQRTDVRGYATSSPTWGGMRVGSADEQFEGKSLEQSANLRLQRRFKDGGTNARFSRARTGSGPVECYASA